MAFFEITNRTKQSITYTIHVQGTCEMPSGGGSLTVRIYVDGTNVKNNSTSGTYRYPTVDSGNYKITLRSGQSATLRGYASSSPSASGYCSTTANLYVNGTRVKTKTASSTGWGAAVNTDNYIASVE